MHEVLDECGEKISFQDFNKKIEGKIEDVEEYLISNDLYKVILDYETKTINIVYVRKIEYEEEDKNKLIEKLSKIKNNMKSIINAIDKI